MFGTEFKRGNTIKMEAAMRSIGIICEYNPFHNGHAAQLRRIREEYGPDTGIVCLMSGNYVQRGEPAIFPKQLRAEAAVLGGADLVLELPLTAALSSAEGFADRGVEILTAFGCAGLSFGSECGDRNLLMSTAKANLDPAFDALLRAELATGCSYPAARKKAIEQLGAGEGLSSPNDVLAVEYCKAILKQHSPMEPLPIRRPGSYHAQTLDPEAPSATALRAALISARRGEHFSSGIRNECDLSKTNPDNDTAAADKQCLSLRSGHSERPKGLAPLRSEESASPVKPSPSGEGAERSEADEGLAPPAAASWPSAVPSCLRELYASAPVHTMAAGERAVLAILRTLPDAAFEALPFGSEGLWSKLMKNCRSCASVEQILEATKSKRYTLSRIRRMLLCAVLGLTAADLERRPPFVRVLAFNDRGRALLRAYKETNGDGTPGTGLSLINAGETPPDPAYDALERRASDLYSLFSAESPRPGGEEACLRVVYHPTKKS